MLRKLTVTALATALLVAGATPAFAQRGGRGGGGGGGGGGRGYNGGSYHGGDHGGDRGWGGFGTGVAIGAGLGYGAGVGYGGYYGGPAYSTAPVYVDPGYSSGVAVPSISNPATGSGYMSAYPSAPTAANAAMINMHVPADAKVFFGDMEGSNAQTGTDRRFVSPPLEPGSNYQYQLRAQWTENGQTVNRTKTVDVRANQTVNVDFMQNQ
jgi:uncharacterized protein (TIGR03000 family)